MAREYDRTTAAEHFSYGKVYLDQGEYENAIEEFKRALALDPENSNILINLGKGYLFIRNFQEATNYFERALEQSPEFADAHYYLGMVYIELNLKEKAINEYKEALNINPRYDAAKHAFNQLMKTIDQDAQEKDIENARVLHPEENNESRQANIRFHLGNALLQKSLFQEALMEYKEAVRLRPNYPDIRNKLGELYMKTNMFNLAEEEFKLALKINPRYISALLNLAETYRLHSEQMLEQAENTYKKVLEINPENSEAKSGLERVRSFKEFDFV